jgi:hypothetical protein
MVVKFEGAKKAWFAALCASSKDGYAVVLRPKADPFEAPAEPRPGFKLPATAYAKAKRDDRIPMPELAAMVEERVAFGRVVELVLGDGHAAIAWQDIETIALRFETSAAAGLLARAYRKAMEDEASHMLLGGFAIRVGEARDGLAAVDPDSLPWLEATAFPRAFAKQLDRCDRNGWKVYPSNDLDAERTVSHADAFTAFGKDPERVTFELENDGEALRVDIHNRDGSSSEYWADFSLDDSND